MFARISGSLAGDLPADCAATSSDGYPANVWIWSEQSIQAQRRRFNCPPFQSARGSNKTEHSSGFNKHRTSIVCQSARRSKHLRTPLKQRLNYAQHAQASPHSAFLELHISASQGNSSSRSSAAQQPKQQTPIDPEQLTACIKAATCNHQLEALCNTFLQNPSFGTKHAVLVISRLHKVQDRPEDNQLLLVELLAAKLATAVGNTESNSPWRQLSAAEVAAVCWGFARVGYQVNAELLQQLLQQFDRGYRQQQQPEQTAADNAGVALTKLIAGLAGLGVRDVKVWSDLKDKAMEALPNLSAASLQQLSWGLATLQQSDTATTAALGAAVLNQLAAFTAEELAQVVWNLHLMGCRDDHLFQKAYECMVGRVTSEAVELKESNSSSRAGVQAVARQQVVHQQQEAGKGGMVAAVFSAAASQAYNALGKYDPMLSTLLLYRKLQPAHGC